MDNRKPVLWEITLYGMLGALTFGAKVAMSFLPNIEPTSLFVMLFAVMFGWKCLYPIYVYVVLEILVYGIGPWNLNYLYVWLILAVLAMCFRKMESSLGWALLSAAFGLAFGLLCAPVDFLLGDLKFVVSKWISGIPYDLLHCAGNFVMALLLFNPLRKLLTKLYHR